MKCPCCVHEIDLGIAQRNLDAYHQGGGSVQVACPECGSPLILRSVIRYVAEHNPHPRGDSDDWGAKYARNRTPPKKPVTT